MPNTKQPEQNNDWREVIENKFNGNDIFWKVILKHLTPETVSFIKQDYQETITNLLKEQLERVDKIIEEHYLVMSCGCERDIRQKLDEIKEKLSLESVLLILGFLGGLSAFYLFIRTYSDLTSKCF